MTGQNPIGDGKQSLSIRPDVGLTTRKLIGSFELEKILERVFSEEAKRLGLAAERFEYSSINSMYQCNNPALETKYFLLNPGNPISRGILGNVLGPSLRMEYGIDISSQLKIAGLDMGEVLFIPPGADVGGYGPLHSFLNTINPVLLNYDLVVAYLRNEGILSFRHGFNDYIGLMKLTKAQLSEPALGEIDLEPIDEVEEGRHYEIAIREGVISMAPIAQCHWDFNHLDGLTDKDITKLGPEDVPLRDRSVNTFHFLNGVTPHYMKQRLTEVLEVITR